jgi:hypothetical protein
VYPPLKLSKLIDFFLCLRILQHKGRWRSNNEIQMRFFCLKCALNWSMMKVTYMHYIVAYLTNLCTYQLLLNLRILNVISADKKTGIYKVLVLQTQTIFSSTECVEELQATCTSVRICKCECLMSKINCKSIEQITQ